MRRTKGRAHYLNPIHRQGCGDVRYEAHSGLKSDIAPCPKSAKNGSSHPLSLLRTQKRATYFARSNVVVATPLFSIVNSKTIRSASHPTILSRMSGIAFPI